MIFRAKGRRVRRKRGFGPLINRPALGIANRLIGARPRLGPARRRFAGWICANGEIGGAHI
jgi:hypothetical protein